MQMYGNLEGFPVKCMKFGLVIFHDPCLPPSFPRISWANGGLSRKSIPPTWICLVGDVLWIRIPWDENHH